MSIEYFDLRYARQLPGTFTTQHHLYAAVAVAAVHHAVAMGGREVGLPPLRTVAHVFPKGPREGGWVAGWVGG